MTTPPTLPSPSSARPPLRQRADHVHIRLNRHAGALWKATAVIAAGAFGMSAVQSFISWQSRDYPAAVSDYGAVRAVSTYDNGQFLLVSTDTQAAKSGLTVRSVDLGGDRLWLVRNHNGRTFWLVQKERPDGPPATRAFRPDSGPREIPVPIPSY